jgi:hypothetical protein
MTLLQMLAQQARRTLKRPPGRAGPRQLNLESAWRKIVASLAGDQFFLGTRPEGPASCPMRTHYADGESNFYSQPVVTTAADPSPPAARGD